MRQLAWFAVLVLGCSIAIGSASAKQEEPEGQKLFLENKCNSCHTIKALNIEKRKKGSGEEAKEESAATKAKKQPPDLSGTGLDRKAEWIDGWLLRKELLDGKKHRKKFLGTEEESKKLAAWLETLKTKPEKKDEAKGAKKEG